MDATTVTRIIPPPDFPVAWPDPDDENYYWTRDREHFPDPVTPMFDSLTSSWVGMTGGGWCKSWLALWPGCATISPGSL